MQQRNSKQKKLEKIGCVQLKKYLLCLHWTFERLWYDQSEKIGQNTVFRKFIQSINKKGSFIFL